jgi:WD40 repeat protein
MHTAIIKRIDVDAQERYLVTASEDKTARVWDLASGTLLQVLRPPMGEGYEGKLYAVAISPDGGTVAVGGYTGKTDVPGTQNIYLFDRASGQLQRRITRLPNGISHLAYSPDGRYLAAALGGGNGIRVYRASDLTEVGRDTDYGSDSYWVDFDRQRRLVSASHDGHLRLYGPDFKLLAKQPAPGGKRPYSARFSPAGDKVAVGFDDSTAVNVLSGQDLAFLYAPDTQGVSNGCLSSVAWSQDGQSLYAGGRYADGSGIFPILKWPQAGRGVSTAWPASTNTLVDIHALANGRLVFGAQDPAFGLLDATGRRLWAQGPGIVDHRGNQDKFLVSPDGGAVQFSFNTLAPNGAWNKRPAQLDLDRQRFSVPATGAGKRALSPLRTEAPGLRVTDWYNTTEPKLNGRALQLQPYETSRSLAIAPDGQHFLLGAEWSLRRFNRQGQQQWQVPVPGTAWAVNLSRDGQLAIAALGDGTVRWYRLTDGKELLAFFPHADGKRWVLWTPEGFFADGDSGGQELIEYHLNQGPDKERQVVKVEQLYDLFYRPDLVALALKDEGREKIAAALARVGDVRKVLAGGLAPELELLSPSETTQTNPDFTLQFKVKDQGGGIGKLVYKVNGNVLEGRPVGIGRPGYDPVSRRFTLAPGVNAIEALVYNGKDQVESRAIRATVRVEQPKSRPRLYVLAVGVSDYRDHSLKLKYAAKDADSMAAELRQRGQGLFESVEVKPLLEDQATLANLGKAFEDLAGQARAEDVFVLYLAGHGRAVDGTYHFVPWEAIYENDQVLRERSLDQDKLQTLLAKVPAQKSLILLDTCESGSFTLAARGSDIGQKTAIDRLMRATGRAVLAATSDKDMALEGHEGHGVFTYALLQGLAGAADHNDNTEIDIDELASYVFEQVPAITKKRWGYEQFPMRDLQGQSFPIGLKKP